MSRNIIFTIILTVLFNAAASLPVAATPTKEAVHDMAGINDAQMKAFEIEKPLNTTYATEDDIALFEANMPTDYLLGPGDEVSLRVWGRDEFTGNYSISPDGAIMLPLIGIVPLEKLNRRDAAELIRSKLARYYEPVNVSLEVIEYRNNKAFVLGRVSRPGVVKFYGQGTLLEALAHAGGLPVLAQDSFLTRCSIIRGKDQIIWIDLDELLNKGNISLNVNIRNNDVIFIPDSVDSMVYVMGEVLKPGAIAIKSELTLMDALMLAGGPTEDGIIADIRLLRDRDPKAVQGIDVGHMLDHADMSKNYLLEDGDIIYVPTKKIKKKSYFFRKIGPFVESVLFGTSLLRK